MSDKKVLLLSDVLPTAWHSTELGGVSKGDRVAIWGAGPGEAYCFSIWFLLTLLAKVDRIISKGMPNKKVA